MSEAPPERPVVIRRTLSPARFDAVAVKTPRPPSGPRGVKAVVDTRGRHSARTVSSALLQTEVKPTATRSRRRSPTVYSSVRGATSGGDVAAHQTIPRFTQQHHFRSPKPGEAHRQPDGSNRQTAGAVVLTEAAAFPTAAIRVSPPATTSSAVVRRALAASLSRMSHGGHALDVAEISELMTEAAAGPEGWSAGTPRRPPDPVKRRRVMRLVSESVVKALRDDANAAVRVAFQRAVDGQLRAKMQNEAVIAAELSLPGFARRQVLLASFLALPRVPNSVPDIACERPRQVPGDRETTVMVIDATAVSGSNAVVESGLRRHQKTPRCRQRQYLTSDEDARARLQAAAASRKRQVDLAYLQGKLQWISGERAFVPSPARVQTVPCPPSDGATQSREVADDGQTSPSHSEGTTRSAVSTEELENDASR